MPFVLPAGDPGKRWRQPHPPSPDRRATPPAPPFRLQELAAERLRGDSHRPWRMRSCLSRCILGRLESRPEDSRRQGQRLVRLISWGTLGQRRCRQLRRVLRAGEDPRSGCGAAGDPHRVSCLPAPCSLSRWDPSPIAPMTHSLEVSVHMPDLFPDRPPPDISHLTGRFRIPFSYPSRYSPALDPRVTSRLPCPGPAPTARPKALVF